MGFACININARYLERVLFDGHAAVDGVVSHNNADGTVRLAISGDEVPDASTVVANVTELSAHLHASARRMVTFDVAEDPPPQPMLFDAKQGAPPAPAETTELELLKRGLLAIEQLIGCSYGVHGLETMDSYIAWGDLGRGGRKAGWLAPYYDALDCINKKAA